MNWIIDDLACQLEGYFLNGRPNFFKIKNNNLLILTTKIGCMNKLLAFKYSFIKGRYIFNKFEF